MADRFDAIVVGGRCAGTPLAALLARRGLRVVVVEKATLPSDTLSSHVFETDALAFFERLGVTERLRATGAPFVDRAQLRFADVAIDTRLPLRPGDPGGAASIRRHLLDPILAEAAAEAGAELRMGTKVTGLLRDGERVVGVEVEREGRRQELRAPLVVGADGRNSTVAKLTGARKYNTYANERIVYWGYFEGARSEAEPTFRFNRWEDRFVIGMPADSGLYQAGAWAEKSELERFGGDHEAMFDDQLASCEPVAEMLEGAKRVGKLLGAVRWEGYFREACGAGWVLTGDAGHFKDPAPGRGIGDALLQADALAPAIAAGLDGWGEGIDREMSNWGRWRDREFAEHHWLAADLGKAGQVPALLVEAVRRLHEQGRIEAFLDVLNHRAKPSGVITPPRVAGALGSLLARESGNRRAILAEAGGLLAEQAQRRWHDLRPAYAS